MRPEEILTPTPSGVCCKIGGFHIDPTRPVDKAADHARPFRPRARRPRRGAGDAGDARHHAAALRREFRRLDAGGRATARRSTLGGAKVTFHPAGHVLGSAQIAVECKGLRIVASGDYKDVADPTCAPFELVPCDVFITEATFGLPVFRHGDADGEIAKLLHSVALFPERAHLVGAYSLGKAQRVIALIRKAGYDKPIYLHGAMEKITRYYVSARHRARRAASRCAAPTRPSLPAPSRSARRRRCRTAGRGAFPIRSPCFASGWMRVRARARQRGVELPLVISDHADWDGLTATIAATGASRDLGHARPGGRAGALVHDARA